jgi:hypothetical protein
LAKLGEQCLEERRQAIEEREAEWKWEDEHPWQAFWRAVDAILFETTPLAGC